MSLSAVAKGNTPGSPFCLYNELICGTIGRVLGLPVPPGGVIQAADGPDGIRYASMDFNLAGNALPPVDAEKCGRELAEFCTALVLFDVLIANTDRHRQNLSVDFGKTPPSRNVFDHSHALLGPFPEATAIPRLAEIRDELAITGKPPAGGQRHCLLDQISSDQHFDKWLRRVEGLPAFVVEDACDDAQVLGLSVAARSAVSTFLMYRRDHIRDMVEASRAEFTAVKLWTT